MSVLLRSLDNASREGVYSLQQYLYWYRTCTQLQRNQAPDSSRKTKEARIGWECEQGGGGSMRRVLPSRVTCVRKRSARLKAAGDRESATSTPFFFLANDLSHTCFFVSPLSSPLLPPLLVTPTIIVVVGSSRIVFVDLEKR